jgi:S-adenosylmethionine-dependent methyltransferase
MTLSGLATRPDAFRQRHPVSPLEGVRHAVTEANLLRHVDSGPQRVLDVAGGNGVEAVRLAALGHEVTVLDPAGAMLRTAIESADAHGVADRLHVVQAGALDAPEVFAGHEFDVVLCHNLLHFLEEPREVLSAVVAPLRAGGLLSVLGPNADFEPVHAAVRDLDPTGAERALAREASVGELVALLAELGVEEVVRYGVRCVSDLLPTVGDDPAFLERLESLEVAMADRMPHLLTARFFHLVARR